MLAFVHHLWRHRLLLWQFVVRGVELRHRGSHLGLAWSILNPILMLGLYVFVFGYIFGGSFKVLPDESRLDYALAIFLGLSIFHFFSEVLTTTPSVIVSNPNFVKKVVFPLEILPAANVGVSLIHFGISLALVLLGVALFGPGLSTRLVWLPLIIVSQVLLALGCGWIFAALGVFFRDILQMVGFVSMTLMFSSAIFYPASSIPPSAWQFLQFNPVLLAVEQARDVIMWDRPVNLFYLTYLSLTGIFASIGGYWWFRKTAPFFADVV